MRVSGRGLAGLLGAGVLLLAVPPLLGSYPLFVLCSFLIFAIGAVGLNVVMGYTGLVSLGHAGFAAIGAYTTGIVVVETGLPYWAALVVGALAAGLAGFLVGVPALRLSPLYLAMVTFSFGEIVVLIAMNWLPVTRGPNGLRIPAPTVAGVTVELLPFYYLLLGISVVLLLAARNLVGSRPGRALMAIRGSVVAAQVAGVHVARYKTAAFAFSAFYAGLAGALYLGVARFITPEGFVFGVSLTYVTMNVVGGMGSLPGAVIGAGVFTLLPELLRGFTKYRELISGFLLLAALLFMPLGVVGLVARWRDRPSAVPPFDDAPVVIAVRDPVVPRPADALRITARPAPMSEPAPLLQVADLSIHFGGVTALDGVTLAVRPREIHALIGPNGSGKTTLLNVLTRIYTPDSGSVIYDGRDLLKSPPHALAGLGLARTFQHLELFGRMTVLDNILVGLHSRLAATMPASIVGTRRARGEEARARADAERILQAVRLDAYAHARADSLAFGHQRLLDVARALATRPRLLLLDEPGAGMPAEEMDAVGALLTAIREEHGTAIVLVAHTMRLVMDVSDRVSVLDHGTLIAEGDPATVAGDPRVIEAYLGKPDAGALLRA